MSATANATVAVPGGLALALALVLLMIASGADGLDRLPLSIVRGNKDTSVDPFGALVTTIVDEFLEGCVEPEPPLEGSAPAWEEFECKRLHGPPLDDSSPYYTHDDQHADHGVDVADIVFYAGHGNISGFSALAGTVSPWSVRVGESALGARYLLMCSCRVFAHGDPVGSVYSDPGSFHVHSQGNAFLTWGNSLLGDPGEVGIRLACGGSTEVCRDSDLVSGSIWHHYRTGYQVSDSFLLGLNPGEKVVPICISRGGEPPAESPLFDVRFNSDPNPHGNGDFFWAQYPVFDESTELSRDDLQAILDDVSERFSLPYLCLETSEPLGDVAIQTVNGLRMGEWLREFVPEDKTDALRLFLAESSNSVYARLPVEPPRECDESSLNTETTPLTTSFVDMLASAEQADSLRRFDSSGPLETIRFELQRVPVCHLTGSCAAPAQVKRCLKSVVLRLRSGVDASSFEAPLERVPVVGEGGYAALETDGSGGLASVSVPGRRILQLLPARYRVKLFRTALEEARSLLPTRSERLEGYELRDWDWGYLEADGLQVQDAMQLVYRFHFGPRVPSLLRSHPPVSIQVGGFEEESEEIACSRNDR